MYWFSPVARQFYVDGVHRHVPDDAVRVTAELHRDFMAAQSRGDFCTIRDGKLVVIDPPAPEADVLIGAARRRRNAALVASDWTQLPDAPLTKTRRDAWRKYRQAMRDVPQQDTFPQAINWPLPPR